MTAFILYFVCVLVLWFVFYAFFFDGLVGKAYWDIDKFEGLSLALLCALIWPLIVCGFIILKLTEAIKMRKENRKSQKERGTTDVA